MMALPVDATDVVWVTAAVRIIGIHLGDGRFDTIFGFIA